MPLKIASAKAEAPGKGDSFAVLKALAEASAVILALTFVGGWSYLSSYYQTFGLNPSLALTRDRLTGVLLGIALMWLVFDIRWIAARPRLQPQHAR